jgi:predicted peptidase
MKTLLWMAVTGSLILSCSKATLEEHYEEHAPTVATLVFNEEKKVNITGFYGYYLTFPSDYADKGALPVLIYLHGLGQKGKGGADLQLLGEDGLGKLMIEKKLPVYFRDDSGNEQSFITISPQWFEKPGATAIRQLIDFLDAKFNIDRTRIYLAGISAGSMALSEILVSEGNKVAAFIPISGVARDPDGKIAKAVAEHDIPVWAFHNTEDTVVPFSYTERFIQNINKNQVPYKAKLTKFSSVNHDAWSRALNPEFRQDGKNIYEWLLQYSKR